MSRKLTIIEAHLSIIVDKDGLVETSVRTNLYGPSRPVDPGLLDLAAETLRAKLVTYETTPPDAASAAVNNEPEVA